MDRQVGKKYSQGKRFQEGYFDCSSLIYRAFKNAGVNLIHKDNGGTVTTSRTEVYAKGFQLIYPDSYNQIGRNYASKTIVNQLKAGDIIFVSPGRTGRISHVMIVNQYGGVTHAANESVGVIKGSIHTHSDVILAIIRWKGEGYTGAASSTSSSQDAESVQKEEKKGKKEITQIKQVYSTGGKPEPKREELTKIEPLTNDKYEILIQHNGQIQIPVVQEGITLQRERKGSPSKLEFTVIKGVGLDFLEGDPISFRVGKKPVFYGYVFRKSRNKEGRIQVTAYDQIRYLKNHDTLQHGEGITASNLLKRICGDYGFVMGELEETGYPLKSTIYEDKALLDILQEAIDLTLVHTGKWFVLYDDFGKITLKDINHMNLNLLVNSDSAIDFDYVTSIEENTYNKIIVAFDNEQTGARELYTAQDGATIGEWGTLQKYIKVEDAESAVSLAKRQLACWNRKMRYLTIKNVMGDIRVRGGSRVFISLNLGDIVVNQQMTVESVKHSFQENEYFMDLTMRGWDFVV